MDRPVPERQATFLDKLGSCRRRSRVSFSPADTQDPRPPVVITRVDQTWERGGTELDIAEIIRLKDQRLDDMAQQQQQQQQQRLRTPRTPGSPLSTVSEDSAQTLLDQPPMDTASYAATGIDILALRPSTSAGRPRRLRHDYFRVATMDGKPTIRDSYRCPIAMCDSEFAHFELLQSHWTEAHPWNRGGILTPVCDGGVRRLGWWEHKRKFIASFVQGVSRPEFPEEERSRGRSRSIDEACRSDYGDIRLFGSRTYHVSPRVVSMRQVAEWEKERAYEFELDQPEIMLHGMVDDAPGSLFSGRLIVHLVEPIRVKGLKMVLEGHEVLDWEYVENNGVSSAVFHRENTPITHKWTFFEPKDGRRAETWEAGQHIFPFSLVFPGTLPETINLPYANVNYQLKASLRRVGIMNNIVACRPVIVKRDLTQEGSFGTGAIDVENRWREKLEFRILANADTFMPGDDMSARFRFQPLVKGMRLRRIGVVFKEYVRCHTATGQAEKTVSRVVKSVEITPRAQNRLGNASLAMAEARRRSLAPPPPPCSSSEGTLLPAAATAAESGGVKNAQPQRLGVLLEHAIEERLDLGIPNDPLRLQFDHISSYIEVTHKLKFSIGFSDPDGRSHTLWISVPISVVPVITDTMHAPRMELPTYANASMDQRVVLGEAMETQPPTYAAVIAQALVDATAAQRSTGGPAAASIIGVDTDVESSIDHYASSSASVYSGDATATEEEVPKPLLRPMVNPRALTDFFHRPIVFPASAEDTPVSTPNASPITSPVFKHSDDVFPNPSSHIHIPPPTALL
ncbi:hypothetical protein GGI07_001566 [Coemansia sp. Benny D115]|nr:hypothetical protein GGI07_001566 [Coemansia sp. Benny D115]